MFPLSDQGDDMIHDALAAQGQAFFDALHAAYDAHEDGDLKDDARVLIGVAHRALERLQRKGSAVGIVRPLDGDPKPF